MDSQSTDKTKLNGQMQINAMRQFYERQISAVTTEGANMAAQCEDFAQQIVALKARVAELELQAQKKDAP